MKMIRLWLCLVLLCYAHPAWPMGDLPLSSLGQPLSGKLAPEFILELLSGKSMSLKEFREGKKAIMIFWATWCPHCREELEALSLKLEEISSKDVKVILVNVGEAREDVQSFLQSRHLALDCFLDEDNTISGLYGVRGVPTALLINEAGVIIDIQNDFPYDYETKFHSR